MIFAPLLILTGIAGFVVPAQYSLMSNATPYNLFHIIFGALGLVLLQTKSDLTASAFNLGFGLIDLYQALASMVGLAPIQYFQWTYADDAHVPFSSSHLATDRHRQNRISLKRQGDLR